LSYQWQRLNGTWGDIPGATGASYTTPATVLEDSGTQFRCVVSNSAGTATSNAATLTVTEEPFVGGCEGFDTGFILGSVIGAHADWVDGGSGPVITTSAGVAASVGLAPATDIFTWFTYPFYWN